VEIGSLHDSYVVDLIYQLNNNIYFIGTNVTTGLLTLDWIGLFGITMCWLFNSVWSQESLSSYLT